MNKLLLALLLAFPVYPAFAQLSEGDKTLIKECEVNIDPAKKLLSPETADKCVKGLNEGAPASLLVRYSNEDAELAAILIGNNNALLDLKEIVVKQNGFHGARALARVMEKLDCALCDMALGPKPEAAFDWVGKYAGDRLAEVQREVRTWDALGNVRTTSLTSADYGKNKGSWNGQNIMSRYSELSTWAQKETDKLVAAASIKAAAGKLDVAGLISVLREDLIFSDDAPYRAKLDALQKTTSEAAAVKKPEAPSAADKKAKELAATGDRLAALAPDQREAGLGAMFDNTGAARPANLSPGNTGTWGLTSPKSETAASAITAVPMTAEDEKKLGEAMLRMEKGKPAGYLAEVMDQTEAGKRTNAFYGDPKYAKAGSNKLAFGFTREPGVFGYWDPDNKLVRINSGVAEEFAAKRGLTVPQLMKDKAAMKDLALYISPTMVHEAEHQNQTARAIASGTDFRKLDSGSDSPYTRAKENLSNTESAKHMIEYCSKNGGPGCYANFHRMHADNAEKFMAGGVEALDTLKAPLYPRIDSFEGGAAREFKAAQEYAVKLKALEAKQRSVFSRMTMTAQEKKDLKDYRDLMDTRFKWYTMSYQENAVNDAEALAFRKKYGTTGPGLAVPAM